MPMIWHTVMHGQCPRQFEKIYTHFLMEGVSDFSYYLWYCDDIAVYQIPTEIGHLLHLNCDCFPWRFQITVSYNKQWHSYLTCFWCAGWIRVYFE